MTFMTYITFALIIMILQYIYVKFHLAPILVNIFPSLNLRIEN